MAIREFLDATGVSFLWNKIVTELNKKANTNDLANVASSGAANDVTITDTGNYFSSGTVEGALQELGQEMTTAGAVSIAETNGSGSILKVYTISQNGQTIGTINIPKDLVATSGEIVNSDGTNSGTFLKLIIANSDPIYINVASLIEYNGVTDSEEIDFTDTNHQISGTLKVGSIAKAKLASGVQTSLGKADTALQPSGITEGATNGTIAVNGTDILVHGLGTAAFTSANTYYIKPQTGIPLADLATGVVPVLAGIGQNSFTDGPRNVASGEGTFAGGMGSTASGQYSMAHGLGTTASGNSSLAIGQGVRAIGDCSVAFGAGSVSNNYGTLAGGSGTLANGINAIGWGGGVQANGNYSSAMGIGLILDTYLTHGFGQFNEQVSPYEFEEWEPSTWYPRGARVKVTTTYDNEEHVAYYICQTANDDDEFNLSHWFSTDEHLGQFVEIVGGGLDSSNRKNIRSLDWSGNEHLYGSLFVYADEDGTGGVPVLTLDDLPVSFGEGTNAIIAGTDTRAMGINSCAFGEDTRTQGADSFVFGRVNGDNDLTGVPSWAEDKDYKYGDIVKYSSDPLNTHYYFSLGSNAQNMFDFNEWIDATGLGKYIEVVGNGYNWDGFLVKSNARALDWAGNQYLMGDLFVHCANDSTNGIKVATTVDTVLTTTLSRGRIDNSTVGDGSIAFGSGVIASGSQAQAFGSGTRASGNQAVVFGAGSQATGSQAFAAGGGAIASGSQAFAVGAGTTASGNQAFAAGGGSKALGPYSHAEGSGGIANGNTAHVEGISNIGNGKASHVGGMFNVADSYLAWEEWTADTLYEVGRKVKVGISENNEIVYYGYICNTQNQDHEFDSGKWDLDYKMNFARIIGNGADYNHRSNALALGWDGNLYLMSDVYVGCDPDSSGGNKVATVADISNVQEGLEVVKLI